MTFPRRAGTQPKAAAVAAPLSLPASGNVAQVMRGILFPSANLLFSVQSIDPGAKKPVANAAAPAGTVDWLRTNAETNRPRSDCSSDVFDGCRVHARPERRRCFYGNRIHWPELSIQPPERLVLDLRNAERSPRHPHPRLHAKRPGRMPTITYAKMLALED